MQDFEDVRALLQLYIDGSNGDVGKLKQAFHQDAHMMGHLGTMDTYWPIDEFYKMVEANPGMAGPNYRAVIRTIDLAGDAGVAVLAETDYLGCDFVDDFSVARIDGRWWITNKTYAHPAAPHRDSRDPPIARQAQTGLRATRTPQRPAGGRRRSIPNRRPLRTTALDTG